MAKGIGKGKDSDDDSCCSCCCACIGCIILTPFFLIIFGFALLFTENTRVQDILSYNNLTSKWEESVEDFSHTSFRVNGQLMEQITWATGSYYPVRDSCDKDGDPEGGCKSAQVAYYKLNSKTYDGYFSLTNSQDDVIYYASYPRVKVQILSKLDLLCLDEPMDCRENCEDNHGGDYSSGECRITEYLNRITIRVSKQNSTYTVDKNPAYPFYPKDKYGCYYSNDYDITEYSMSPSSVLIEIRHSADAYLLADYYTKGCSSTSTNNNNAAECFGSSSEEQIFAGYASLILGFIILVIYICIIVAICACCKSSFNKKYGKKIHKKTKNSSQIQNNMNNGIVVPTVSPIPTNYATQPYPANNNINSYPTAQPMNPSIPVAQTYNNYPIAQPYTDNNNFIPTAQFNHTM
ncbi:hypothetical protein WA158_006121 [Blastocystis sp. Blastoise]